MKRGFLNSAKVKKAQAKRASEQKKTSPQEPQIPSPEYERKLRLKPSYGVVDSEDRGLPKDYVPEDVEWKTIDANFTSYKDNFFLITTQPSQIIGETLENCSDGWSECHISGYAKRQIMSTPGFPQPIRRPPVKSYEIKEIPNKGLGIVATRHIQTGDLIFAERAIMIWHSNMTKVMYHRKDTIPEDYTREQINQVLLYEQERMLEVLFNRVDPTLQEAYKALHNSHQFDGSGPLVGIGRTNGFGIGLTDEDTATNTYTGIFNQGSRFNHSCMANVDRRWDLASFAMEFRACRDIKAGEELTVSYICILDPVASRQKALEPYGFQCSCPACLTPTPAESYTRRHKFKKAFPMPQEWGMWMMNPQTPDDQIIKPCLEQLRVCDEEGLHACQEHIQAYLEVVMLCYQMLGDEKNVTKYGELLGRQVLSETGDDTELKTFRRLNYHRSQSSWNLRNTGAPAGFNLKWDHFGKVAEMFF